MRELSNAPRWVAIGFLCGLACLAGLGAYSIWSATRLGPGLGSDSAAYIAGAQNLASGDGFVWKMGPADVRPITHRPPLYSVLLASFEFLPPSHPVGALIGTRVTGMVLFAATIALTGWLVFRLTRSMVIGLLGAGLVLGNAGLITTYSRGMSEGLYLTLSAVVLLLGVGYQNAPSRGRVAALGVAVGLLALTKYIGLSALLAVAAVILLSRRLTRRTTPTDLAVFVVVACSPIVLFLIRNELVDGTALHRSLMVHPLNPDDVKTGIQIVSRWFLPMGVADWLTDHLRTRYLILGVAAVAAGVAAMLLQTWRATRRGASPWAKDDSLPVLAAAMAITYVAFHAGAVLFSTPTPDTDERTLSGLVLPLIVVVAWALERSWRSTSSAARAAAMLAGCVLFVGRPAEVAGTVTSLSAAGSGYSSPAWSESPLIRTLRTMKADVVYTDDEGAVFLLAGIQPYSLPDKWNSTSGVLNPEYARGLERMRERLRRGGLLVLFFDGPRLPEHPDYGELKEGLAPILEAGDGGIYTWPSGSLRSSMDRSGIWPPGGISPGGLLRRIGWISTASKPGWEA